MINEYNGIKFQLNEEYGIELAFDEPIIKPSVKFPGKQSIWYGIKPLINGENGFNATENLHALIKESVELKKGATFTIQKLQGEKFTYFTVNGKTIKQLQLENKSGFNLTQSNATIEDASIHYTSNDEKSMEQKVNELWDYHEANIISKEDEDIPY